jgi:uncharacterized repeat protein (TIGR03803 family)
VKPVVFCIVVLLAICLPALGQQYKVLWEFDGLGGYPRGTLVFDKAGNIYGTTPNGGNNCSIAPNLGCGILFELSLSGGEWTFSQLYTFCMDPSCTDGALPYAGLVLDEQGNLYGTTIQGGSQGSGTVFELSPPTLSGGQWTETVIHNFCSTYRCADGYFPYSKLLMDVKGRLYGTTSAGGDNTNCRDGCGTVFRLTPPQVSGQAWHEDAIYTFCTTPKKGHCPDGESPMIGLVSDKSGNFYGTTQYGGSNFSTGQGVVFELSQAPNGWTERVLDAFPRSGAPSDELALDKKGRIYGVSGSDSVYRIDVGDSTLQRLSLILDGFSSGIPLGGLLVDPARNLVYGTVPYSYPGKYGSILSIGQNGQIEDIYDFQCPFEFDCSGVEPSSTLVEDSQGNLYGTTLYGGAENCPGSQSYSGCGVVFEFTPN